ncbi:MAG: hypothetical protein ACI4MN_06025 [Candidatus Coproplasma sp.]
MTYLEWKRHISIFRFIRGKNVYEAIPEELEMLIYCKYKAALSDSLPVAVTLVLAEEEFTITNIVDSLTYAINAVHSGEISVSAKPIDSLTLAVTPESTAIIKVRADNVIDSTIEILSPEITACMATKAQMRDTDICGVITYQSNVTGNIVAVSAVSGTTNVSASAEVLLATQLAAIQSMTCVCKAELGADLELNASVKFDSVFSTEYTVSVVDALKSQMAVNFETVSATEFNVKADNALKGLIIAKVETISIVDLLKCITTNLVGQIQLNISEQLNDELSINLSTNYTDTVSVNIAESSFDEIVRTINTNFIGIIDIKPEITTSLDFNVMAELPDVEISATVDTLTFEAVKVEETAELTVSVALACVAKATVEDYSGKSVDELSDLSVEDSAYIEV